MEFRFAEQASGSRENSAARIQYLEQKYGIVFPEILREFYATTDSGGMKPCEIELNGRRFYPSSLVTLEDGDLDFEYAADNDRDEPMCQFVPADWYPFAYDGSGNLFYWSSRTQQVFFLDQEDADAPVQIAESIEEFMEMLNNAVTDEE